MVELLNPDCTIWKPGRNLKFTSHRNHKLSQCADVHVCPPLHFGNRRLIDSQGLCETLLRKLARRSQLI
jgi:hypothetical protein